MEMYLSDTIYPSVPVGWLVGFNGPGLRGSPIEPPVGHRAYCAKRVGVGPTTFMPWGQPIEQLLFSDVWLFYGVSSYRRL